MELESSSPYPQAPAICPYGCVILPLETLPPGDPNGGVIYLRNILSPDPPTLSLFLIRFFLFTLGCMWLL
jgi:hypothetical protein